VFFLAKLLMLYINTCCAFAMLYITHARLEVYCGTNQHTDELGGDDPTRFSADPNSGPAAVITNLHEVLPAPEEGVCRAVVTDRFYTSVQLALQLLARNVYTIGTIQTNKRGFPPALVVKEESRPANVPRGTTASAVAKCCPELHGGTDFQCIYSPPAAALPWRRVVRILVSLENR
jgi:hypothetical protein